MYPPAPATQKAYDKIANGYDAQWSVHVEQPQRRLTRELELRPRERCVDLGCGTGVDTLEMGRAVQPGEMWAVDPSAAMLQSALERAQREGLTLVGHCQGADDFIAECQEASFDVISLRFCLGYLDWRTALPRLPRLLRAGGRVGILTILASSAPQARKAYAEMAREFDLPDVPLTALPSLPALQTQLNGAGAQIASAWTHRFRLDFEHGAALAAWLQQSGIAANDTLSALPPEVGEALWAEFARRVESQRTRDGLALDFELAGVVATRDGDR